MHGLQVVWLGSSRFADVTFASLFTVGLLFLRYSFTILLRFMKIFTFDLEVIGHQKYLGQEDLRARAYSKQRVQWVLFLDPETLLGMGLLT